MTSPRHSFLYNFYDICILYVHDAMYVYLHVRGFGMNCDYYMAKLCIYYIACKYILISR